MVWSHDAGVRVEGVAPDDQQDVGEREGDRVAAAHGVPAGQPVACPTARSSSGTRAISSSSTAQAYPASSPVIRPAPVSQPAGADHGRGVAPPQREDGGGTAPRSPAGARAGHGAGAGAVPTAAVGAASWPGPAVVVALASWRSSPAYGPASVTGASSEDPLNGAGPVRADSEETQRTGGPGTARREGCWSHHGYAHHPAAPLRGPTAPRSASSSSTTSPTSTEVLVRGPALRGLGGPYRRRTGLGAGGRPGVPARRGGARLDAARHRRAAGAARGCGPSRRTCACCS